jgi:hypothetical protein
LHRRLFATPFIKITLLQVLRAHGNRGSFQRLPSKAMGRFCGLV